MDRIEALGAVVWGIAPESTKNQQKYVERSGLSFPLLSDDGSRVIRAYGVLNEEQGTVPHPAVVVIDADGVIRAKHVDPDYTVRPSADEVLGWLESAVAGAP